MRWLRKLIDLVLFKHVERTVTLTYHADGKVMLRYERNGELLYAGPLGGCPSEYVDVVNAMRDSAIRMSRE